MRLCSAISLWCIFCTVILNISTTRIGVVSAQAATSATSPNVQSTTVNTTFTTIASYIPPGTCQINAYSVNSTFLYSVNASSLQNYDVAHYPKLVNVGYLMLGEGSTEIGFYSPYGGPGNAKMLAAVMLAMNDFIVNGRDPITKEDTVSIRLIIGDWQHDYTTFCQLYNYPMPDIIVIGTTAISAAASKEEILALDRHLDEYTQLHNTLLVDSFLKYTLYDYYYTNSWWAVPLTTDTRLLYYNRTTFKALNMKMPPPEGDWGVQYWNDWNWTTFVDYATQIRNLGLGHGYQFYGEFDEESKLITLVARSKILDLFPSNRQCNLLSPIFTEILDDFIRPLWTPTANGKFPTVANLDFYTTDDNEPLTEWLSQPYEDVVPPDFTIFTGNYGDSSILGMNIDTPANTQYSSNWMLDAINGSNLTEESEIGIGYVPASASFLGGSGLALASTSNKTEIAWNLIVQMIDPNQIYLNIINQANGLYPPYDTSSQYPPWSLPQFTVAREQVSHAVPMQYPHTSFPQVSDFENAHIFRQLLLNIVVKNSTNSQAVDAACNVMMEILAPECNGSNWYPSYPETCQPGTQDFMISYQWTNTSGIACKGPTTLPKPYPIACAYANIDTRQSITMLTLTSICALISIIYGVLLFVYRRTAVVKRASFVFCELVLVGSLFIYSTVYFLAGPAYTWKCQLVIWTVVIGFALLFGSLFCKILRVYKIFNNKAFVTLRLTDWYLLKRLGVILVVEILGLIVLAKVDGGPHAVAYSTYTDPASGQEVMQNKCVYGNLGALIYIAVFNLFLIIYAVALSIATWKVPTQYNESKFVIAASYAVGFGAILLAPLIFFVTDPVARLMIIGLTIDFGVVISVSIFCVPKIYTAIRLYRQETIRQHTENTLERVRSGRSCNCGEVHHPWWKFWRHQSDNCPAQLVDGHAGNEKRFKPQQPFIQENIHTKFGNQGKPKSRPLSPGSLGWVYEEDVLRTSKTDYMIRNVNDLNIAPNEEAMSLTETGCCSPELPAKTLTRRSTIDRRTSSVSSMSEAPRSPLQSTYPDPLSIGDPRWNRGHCRHCGTGFNANTS